MSLRGPRASLAMQGWVGGKVASKSCDLGQILAEGHENYVTAGDLLEILAQLLPQEVGLCEALVDAFRHDPDLEKCKLGPLGPEARSALGGALRVAPIERLLSIDTTLDHSFSMEAQASKSMARNVSEADGEQSSGLAKKGTPWFPEASTGGFCRRLFTAFDVPSSSIASRVIGSILLTAIAVSTVSFVLESMPAFRYRKQACAELRLANRPLTVEACEPQPHESFFTIEAVCIVLFTIDYVVRMATIHSVPAQRGSNGVLRTLAYARQPLNLVDLIAILPFYVGLVVDLSLGPVRILRLARIFRLFKAAKHHPGIMMFYEVMVMSGQPLLILVFFNVILTVLFGSLIYYAEGQRFSVDPRFTGGVDPPFPHGVYVRSGIGDYDEASPFRTIPRSIWWTLVTMTTVGYGDYAPTTAEGKVIGIICFYVGVIFLALPISVLGTNFEFVYNRMLEEKAMKNSGTPVAAKSTPKKKKDKPKRSGSSDFGHHPWLPGGDGIRRRIFLLLEDPVGSRLGKINSLFIIAVILVSTAAFVMESMETFNYVEDLDVCLSDLTVANCQPVPLPYFNYVEIVSIVIFTADYFGRVATVHAVTPAECGVLTPCEDQPVKLTVLYCLQWLNIIDVFAILPFYLAKVAGSSAGASFLRVLRLVRVFRVLKMPKLKACAEMFIDIVSDALPALGLLLFMTTLMCVLFASLIVFAEGTNYSVDHFQDLYPEGCYVRPTPDGFDVEVSPFRSILHAFWWFFTTATTVGYGDEVPTTTWGRIVGVMTFYSGILLLALPITIVGGCFNKYYPEWVKNFGDSLEKGLDKRELPGTTASPGAIEGETNLSSVVPIEPGSVGPQERDGPSEAWS
eukprot:TRINITY_DN15047_c0_g3_i3.p1 TRINITY_DN15047_c0_g3~~TRINITY_DN15047_c0_g3_i3.p1  ORF type:complete len:853 (-),score=114.02 TRINITY_DN15047_c0_g3_i3:381-2939(-)